MIMMTLNFEIGSRAQLREGVLATRGGHKDWGWHAHPVCSWILVGAYPGARVARCEGTEIAISGIEESDVATTRSRKIN